MNEIVVHQQHQQLTAFDIRSQVNLVQEVMQAVMKKDTHYGTIPGTPKPSLWKPGAEVLAATFRIAVSYRVEDLSTADVVRYRVIAVGTHQTTGIVMGEGMGECSSGEAKYKWRKASQKEFAATPEDRRRVQYGYDKYKKQEYEVQQVRTEPADLANTVLKMACKRAQVAMTLNVTAASDIFTQDIEDLPEELRPSVDTETGEIKKAEPKAPAFLSDELFAENSLKWKKSISAGKKSVIEVINWVNTQGNGKITAAQQRELENCAPKQEEKPAETSPAIDPTDIPF